MKKKKIPVLDYPILKPFRLNGRWILPSEKTVQLTLAQRQMFILGKKVGAALADPLVSHGVIVETGLILDCKSEK